MKKYKITHPQQRIVYTELQTPNTALNNIPCLAYFPPSSTELLQKAIEYFIANTDDINVRFVIDDNKDIMQYISNSTEKSVDVFDFTQQTDIAIEKFLIELAAKPFASIFDAPLYYFAIITTAEKTLLFCNIHHSISDGTGLQIILKSISAIFAALENNEEPVVATSNSLKYIDLEEQYLHSRDFIQDKEYWQETLMDLSMVQDKLPTTESVDGKTKSIILPAPFVARIKEYTDGLAESISPFVFMLTVSSVYLARMYRSQGFLFNMGYANRVYEEINDSIGMFVNMVPVKVTFDFDQKLSKTFPFVKQSMKTALRHSQYPFDVLMNDLAKKGEDVGSLLDFSITTRKHQFVERNAASAPFVLRVNLVEGDGLLGLQGFQIEYKTACFTDVTIEGIMQGILAMLEDVIQNPDKKLSELTLVSQEQVKKIASFNATQKMYDNRCTSIVEMFKQQVKRVPNNIAVVFGENTYTYEMLDEITDKLARKLKSLGVGREKAVGILIERSEYMAIYPLAVLKAGGAYMPLDYTFPTERLEFMIKDANVTIILSEDEMVERCLPDYDGVVIKTVDLASMEVSKEIPLEIPAPNDMFVILFTSGSTGMPKGCILEQENIANYCKWYQSYYAVSENDRSAAYANFGFDASMMDLYPFITCGASVYIIPSGMRLDFIKLNQYFEEHHISIGFMTTQLGMQFVETFDNKSLRALTIGGEKLFTIKKPSYKLYNAYGPTECTIIATVYEIVDDYDSAIIGSPIDNYELYILDSNMQVVPIGAAGELCIGGAGVSRGYLNREDLTTEKFIIWNGKRLYRSGDLAKWNDKGEIEFVGRIDGQVKLRGLRIELGEIESQFLKFAGITNCAVVVKELGGTQHLCSYFTADSEIPIEELREYLLAQLATFMIPTTFTRMETMPLTPNGKLNRKALPDPVIEQQEIIKPETKIQQQLFALIATVVGTEDFGIHTDLFTVGMTSLLAIKITVSIYKEFNVNIKSNDIIKSKTIVKLEEMIQKANPEQFEFHEKREFYPLTENQMGIYYEWEKEPEALQYNIPIVLEFSNHIHSQRLQRAAALVINAHSYLKTYLALKDGALVQCANDYAEANVTVQSVTEEEFDRIKNNFIAPFDLFKGPLYNIAIYCTPKQTYLLADFHHIIFDGSSMQLFIDDLSKAYGGVEITAETHTAFAVALDEEKAEQSPAYLKAEAFFASKLSACHSTQLPKCSEVEGHGTLKNVAVNVDKSYIDEFCKQYGITPNNLFLAALNYTLHRYTNEADVVITTISNGRSESRLSAIMGMFVKTLPVVSRLETGEQTLAFIKRTQQDMFDTIENELYPFTKMAAKHKLVMEINFAYQGGLITKVPFEDELVAITSLSLEKPKFPLAIGVNVQGGSYQIVLDYDDSLYTHEYIENFGLAIGQCAQGMVQSPTASLEKVSLLTREQKLLLDSFNETGAPFKEQTMIEVFGKSVETYADKTALVAVDQSMTYRELNRAANPIANALIAQGVKPEDKVAFLLPRDSRLICSIWGIIKAGGAYIPIDPEYPMERINHVLTDSDAKYIITTTEKNREMHFDNALLIDELLQYQEQENPRVTIDPENLCYIIYTSGSTGKPKGVMIEHRNLVQYVLPFASNLYISSFVKCNTILSLTTVSFDVFVEEVMVTLSNGLTLAFADEGKVNNPLLLAEFIDNKKIDFMAITPSLIIQYLETKEFAHVLRKVKVISCGGEKFPANFYPLLRGLTDAVIFNIYGPTEATISTNAKVLTGQQITIGKPFTNVTLYVVDKDFNRLPIGVMGELLIGGKGVGRGYLNRPELTAETFIMYNNERVYRSGDYAKWTTTGEIEILGRMDNQIKLRGLRIELGEIEACLNAYDNMITSVVVIKKLQGVEHLCAYYTGKTSIDSSKLREHLEESLTQYMVPTTYTQLEQMPTTPNGKTDVKALPDPIIIREEIIKPQTKVQEQLFNVIAQLLGTTDFGINTDLFTVGMTSLTAIKITVAIYKEFTINIKTNEIIKSKTIVNLEKLIQSTAPEEEETYERREYYPLAENQRGIYYDCEKQPEALQYNIPYLLEFSSNIKSQKLQEAGIRVINAHPYLKTYLAIRDEEIVQMANSSAEILIPIIKINQGELENRKNSFVKPFDLFKGPLYRMEIYYTEEHTYLFADFHHIIFDGSSLDIFFEDLAKAFGGVEIVAEKYTAFDVAQREIAAINSKAYLRAEEFFHNKLSSRTMTQLPKGTSGQGDGVLQHIDIQVDNTVIDEFCKNHGITPNNLFLGALSYTLHRYTNEADIAITTISNGRGDNRLSTVLGMFVKTLPVVSTIKTEEQILDFIRGTQQNLFDTMENELYPFTKMVEKYKLVPEISFAYQGGLQSTVFFGEERVAFQPLSLQKPKFPLAIGVEIQGDGYHIVLAYDDRLYTYEVIETFGLAMGQCVKNMAINADKKLRELTLVSPEDKSKLLNDFQGEYLAYDKNATFLDLFAEQVEQRPDAIALVDIASNLTYDQTNYSSDELAKKIIALGVKANSFIGIMLPRQKEFMVSVLATMKARGAYLPLDSSYPKERIDYMLQDSEAQVLITQRKLFEEKGGYDSFSIKNVVFIEEIDFVAGADCTRDVKLTQPMAEDLAYMIYTSGSTGKPKGVMIPHKALAAFLAWRVRDYALTCDDKMCCHSSFSFDASVYDLFAPLVSGGQLHIISDDMRYDMAGLYEYIGRNKITHCTFATQFGMELLRQFDVTLKTITLGGEKLQHVPKRNVKLINGYGPTEFTISSNYYEVNQEEAYDNIPIGKPVANSWAYVVDRNNSLLPIGMPGELCLSGLQIANGYWKREELTQEKFVDNPYKTCDENAKMYHTGDLVRWNKNGELECLGRIDSQIKLRGFRIELGEIEAAIGNFNQIIASVVDVKEINSAQHLCGYFTAHTQIDVNELKESLSRQLTEYMVPTLLMQLDKIPLTPNGKVDKKALPEPELVNNNEYVAPGSELEAKLCDAFATTLNLEQVGIMDSFFEIGGTSLLATKVVIKAMNEDINISYGDVFKYQTPQNLAQYVMNKVEDSGGGDAITNYDYTAINQILPQNRLPQSRVMATEVLGDILLTGATGFLGIHILRDFLTNYNGRVYCLIRPKTNIATEQRLKSLLVYYFEQDYSELFGNRIFVIEGDITDTELRSKINVQVDTVINCAANVKHFAAGNAIEKINVDGVVNLIDYCLGSGSRLIQVSTTSIAGDSVDNVPPVDTVISEAKLYVGQSLDNKYINSKFLAERYVLAAVAQGLQAKIMRVGNLMSRDADGEFQINSHGNAYMARLRAYKLLGKFPLSAMGYEQEFSPIDSTATAILKLTETNSDFTVFHPCNNHIVYLADVIYAMKEYGFAIDIVSDEEYAAWVQEKMQDEKMAKVLSGILAYKNSNTSQKISYLGSTNKFTTNVLYHLGYKWPVTSESYIKKAIEALDGLGFFDE